MQKKRNRLQSNSGLNALKMPLAGTKEFNKLLENLTLKLGRGLTRKEVLHLHNLSNKSHGDALRVGGMRRNKIAYQTRPPAPRRKKRHSS